MVGKGGGRDGAFLYRISMPLTVHGTHKGTRLPYPSRETTVSGEDAWYI